MPKQPKAVGDKQFYFAPTIPTIPITHFSRLPIDRKQFQEFWRICGPTAERNMMRGFPIWEVITAAYLEGLQHGSAIQRELTAKGGSDVEDTHTYWS